MEKLKRCYANFDFDISLLGEKFSKDINPNSKYNKNLQYLFFWTAKEDELLYSTNDQLLKTYETKVKLHQDFIPGLTKNKENLIYWWGDCSSFEKWELEREINSKFTSHKIEQELNISIKSKIGLNQSDLPIDIKDFIFKKDHGFSGQGFVKDINNIRYPILIEKKLDRDRDYGSIVNSNSCHTFRNIIDKHGQYIGTYLDNTVDNYKNFKGILSEIFTKYKEKFSISSVQIDSFSYFVNGEQKFRPLCEVNHRKSMGWVTNKLNDKFGSSMSLFLIIPKHRFKNLSDNVTTYDKNKKEGTIQLSVDDEQLQSFFITSENKTSFINFVHSISLTLKNSEDLSNFISSI